MSYEQLVKRPILDPLGMKSTTILLTPDERRRIAKPYEEGLNPVGVWDFDVLAGAGALRSTADDMLTFAAANIGLIDTPLKLAMERMRSFRRPGQAPGMEQVMGWLVMKPTGAEMLIHDGGAHGFRSAITIDPASQRASVAWANAPLEVTDVTAHLMELRLPLPTLDPVRTAIQLPEETLASYLAEYQLARTFSIAIAREGQRLFEQVTNQARFEIFQEKEDEFFLRVVNAQTSFTHDEASTVIGLILPQNGAD
jgi:D-alanyl-D-alanine-carboxypeptidase/D-alanyl-D-alanine-endopeptidase